MADWWRASQKMKNFWGTKRWPKMYQSILRVNGAQYVNCTGKVVAMFVPRPVECWTRKERRSVIKQKSKPGLLFFVWNVRVKNLAQSRPKRCIKRRETEMVNRWRTPQQMLNPRCAEWYPYSSSNASPRRWAMTICPLLRWTPHNDLTNYYYYEITFSLVFAQHNYVLYSTIFELRLKVLPTFPHLWLWTSILFSVATFMAANVNCSEKGNTQLPKREFK